MAAKGMVRINRGLPFFKNKKQIPVNALHKIASQRLKLNAIPEPTLSSSKKHFFDLYSSFILKLRSVHENGNKTHRSSGYCCWSH